MLRVILLTTIKNDALVARSLERANASSKLEDIKALEAKVADENTDVKDWTSKIEVRRVSSIFQWCNVCLL